MSYPRPMTLPDSFNALFDYLRSRGYAEGSILEYRRNARWVTKFMQEHGYDSYTLEAYTAVIKFIEQSGSYEELSEYEKRRYHCATVLYEFQQTGTYTFRRKKAEESIQGGLKAEIESFMDYRKTLLLAERTLQQQRLNLLRFNIFLVENGITDVNQITTEIVLKYIQERLARFTQTMIISALSSIRQFLFYLHETGRTPINFSLVVPSKSAPAEKRVPSIYSENEIGRLLDVIDRADPKGKRDYAMILIASRLGLRGSDICQLKFSELDWKQNRILLKQKKTGTKNGRRDLALLSLMYDTGARVQEIADMTPQCIRFEKPSTIRIHGKGNKTRIVPMMDAQVSVLKRYMTEQNLLCPEEKVHPLFRNKYGDKLTRAGVSYILDKYVSLAREANPDLVPENISCHSLRHSKAMHLLQSGVNLVYIRDFLGHYSIQTTEIYAKADSRQKREALEKAYVDVTPDTDPVWQANNNLLEWLVSLGK